LNDSFRLRDCAQTQEMVFAEQAELFPIARTAGCLRYEISTCTGPCVGACTRSQFMERVRAARSFLAGSDLRILDAVEHKMAEASADLAFERAAALRDKWQKLHWLKERLEHMRSATARSACVYPVDGYGGANLWYLIQGGRIIASMPAPTGAEEKEAALPWIDHTFRKKKTRTTTVPPGELDGVLLVAAWFRRHPQEQARIFAAGEVAARVSIS
jgi:excinuclease ABC subunit C